jgi:uncharacterized protein (DUF1330 family)
MSYELLVALNVNDPQIYSDYRAAMTPILLRYGGGFRYDFIVAETLKQEATHPINRVFVIAFTTEDHKTSFFADPEYQAVKKQFFDHSVLESTIIARYGR